MVLIIINYLFIHSFIHLKVLLFINKLIWIFIHNNNK